MKIKNYLLITGTMLLFLCCAGSKGDGQISIQERFDLGLENLENEKYLKAQTDFKNVLLESQIISPEEQILCSIISNHFS